MLSISVVIPARDAEGFIPQALRGLESQDLDRPFEVIVVDNGSRDATAARAAESPVTSQVLRLERGHGPGHARNAGVAVASGELIAFTDADCQPLRGWLRAGSQAAAEADVVQGPITLPLGARPHGFDRTLHRDRFSPLFEAANLFIRRRAFEAAGGFPAGLEGRRRDELEAPFGEDALLGWRAVRRGARIRFCPEAVVAHAVIRRGAWRFMASRRRLRYFPRLAAEVPELREQLFYRRWFLSRRSAYFDLAVAGLLAASLSGRRGPLVAAAPYLGQVAAGAPSGSLLGVTRLLLARAGADAVGCLALARGSLEARTPVL